MESSADKFEVVTNELISRMKEVFKPYSDHRFDVYKGEYLKEITISDNFRDIRINFDKIIPASMYLDRATKLQVRVECDDWLSVVISIPVEDDDVVTIVLKALNEYFNNRVDSAIKDLNILKSCSLIK